MSMHKNYSEGAWEHTARLPRVSSRAQIIILFAIGVPVALLFAIGAAMMVQDVWLNLHHTTFDGSAYCGTC